MSTSIQAEAMTVLLVGLLIAVGLLAKAGAARLGLPPVAAWILLGIGFRSAAAPLGLLSEHTIEVLLFLSRVGVAIMLFRIGLESKLARLAGELGRAWIVWVGNVVISGLVGYAAGRYLLGVPPPTALVLGVALTATSVGVTVGVWRAQGALDTPRGRLLLDVAELDDISSIVLMGLLFAILPVIAERRSDASLATILSTSGRFLVRMAIFSLLCVLFARYLERPLTGRLTHLEQGADPMLSVIAVGLTVAAVAGAWGFSMALGAFFAGLAFSRDPRAVGMDASFDPLYDLFTPFFFIHIGAGLDAELSPSLLTTGGLLLAAAVAGKIGGAMIPGAAVLGWRGAAAVGISLLPRAEVTMIVAQNARAYAPELIPRDLYGAMAAVSLATCLLAPPLTRWVIRHTGDRRTTPSSR